MDGEYLTIYSGNDFAFICSVLHGYNIIKLNRPKILRERERRDKDS